MTSDDDAFTQGLQFQRGQADDALRRMAVSDAAHLLAELVDNALAFSPPTGRVLVFGRHLPGAADDPAREGLA